MMRKILLPSLRFNLDGSNAAEAVTPHSQADLGGVPGNRLACRKCEQPVSPDALDESSPAKGK